MSTEDNNEKKLERTQITAEAWQQALERTRAREVEAGKNRKPGQPMSVVSLDLPEETEE